MTSFSDYMYSVNTIYKAIQGEGALTGTPMILLRLQGCDVGCPFCDTKETWETPLDLQVNSLEEATASPPAYVWLDSKRLASAIRAIRGSSKISWVMVTGGEPLLHNLEPLIEVLHAYDFKVQLETSGTETLPNWLYHNCDYIVVSPKEGMPSGKTLTDTAMGGAHEIKYVVGKRSDIERLNALLDSFETRKKVRVSVQPMSQSEKATSLCVDACLQFGWHLSIQTHKYINLP